MKEIIKLLREKGFKKMSEIVEIDTFGDSYVTYTSNFSNEFISKLNDTELKLLDEYCEEDLINEEKYDALSINMTTTVKTYDCYLEIKFMDESVSVPLPVMEKTAKEIEELFGLTPQEIFAEYEKEN